MAVDKNKSELFKLVGTEVTSLAKDIETIVVVTHKDSVVSNKEIDKKNSWTIFYFNVFWYMLLALKLAIICVVTSGSSVSK